MKRTPCPFGRPRLWSGVGSTLRQSACGPLPSLNSRSAGGGAASGQPGSARREAEAVFAALRLPCAQAIPADDTSGKVDTGGEYTLFGMPFTLNGFITQEFAMGVDPYFSGKNVTDYFSAQIEWQYKLSDWLSLYGINRILGDWAYDIHNKSSWFDDATATPAQHSDARDNLAWETNKYDEGWEVFRELYADISAGDFRFRLGKQQVIWGQSDGLRLMDCINPQDLRREFNLRDSDEGYEYTRIPLWLLKTNYIPKIEPFGIRDLNFELIMR